ncbi:MAG: hypothetical protein BWX71_00734 [Deltaproteobacteria bacterium ADurb.Bin072]|nr:MAG: hypothetical protein BWX71_00734 [Deltaproteobacteria bacterium ADurb.Bin072]
MEKKSDHLKFLPKKDLFNVDEVAELFGKKPATIYKWIGQWRDQGETHKFCKVPGAVFVMRKTLIDMIDSTGSA